MNVKKNLIITLVIALLIFFLRSINILQIENGFGNPLIIIMMILFFSYFTIAIQNNIDHNHKMNNTYYQNLDILKYFSAILILILHLRPFINYSDQLDLTFNNIVTRICVPLFLMITGYFVSKKEVKDNNYIDNYIKRTIPLYLGWSILYLPFTIGTIFQYLPQISEFIHQINPSFMLLLMMIIVIIPFGLFIALCYIGIYYHLWYFPALIFSLLTLKIWKNKYSIKSLLFISLVLLFFGATETYYGVLPLSIKQVITYYYSVFFTTRNFLFFGLFYVVLGYVLGTKESVYSNYCFLKLIVCFLLLTFESILLHDTTRLDSNILLSCIPLTYYLFISSVYISNTLKLKFQFGNYSKYYYLLHPMIIYLISIFNKNINHPYLYLMVILFLTHISSYVFLQFKNKYRKMII